MLGGPVGGVIGGILGAAAGAATGEQIHRGGTDDDDAKQDAAPTSQAVPNPPARQATGNE